MGLLLVITIVYLAALIIEALIHHQRIRKIPIRISVSGTRGKSTIVRLLASVLRESGVKVIAKSTGSEATYILPDGSFEPVKRRGGTNILEQKKFIRKAVACKADFAIAEIMSIQAENHRLETGKLIQPGISLITNFTQDHIESAGEEDSDMLNLYLNDVFPGSKVIIHEKDVKQELLQGIEKKKAEAIIIGSTSDDAEDSGQFKNHFIDNLAMVKSIAEVLNIDKSIVKTGIEKARLDIGGLEEYKISKKKGMVTIVNAFAANDPSSSEKIIEKILDKNASFRPSVYGLLSLRHDREGRTKQWLDYLRSSESYHFSGIYVIGSHSRILARKLENVYRIKDKTSENITNRVLDDIEEGSILVGLGNIKGEGLRLIEYWRKITKIN